MAEIAVIGAGLAGLTAAYRLQQAGHAVQVFEAGADAGGRLRTELADEHLLDLGADAFSEGFREYLALVDELGLRDRVVPLPTVFGVVRDGRVIYQDAASRWAMATTPMLSLWAKWRLLRGMPRLKALAPVDARHLHLLAALDDASSNAAAFSRRHFGDEATRYLVDPTLRTLNGTGAEGCSCVDVLSAFDFVQPAPLCLRGGQALLPQALAARVPGRYNTEVSGVDDRDDGVRIWFHDGRAAVLRFDADACVLATPFESAVRLYAPLARWAEGYSAGFSHTKLIKIHVGYSRRTTTRAYAVQVPTCEDPEVMVIFLDHNKCDDRAPPEQSLMTLYIETRATPEYIDRDDDKLAQWASAKLERWFPELAGQRNGFQRVTRWPMMAPASTPGFYRRAQDVLDQVPQDGLVQLACDMFTKSSQEAAVAWGGRAASRLIERFSKPHLRKD